MSDQRGGERLLGGIELSDVIVASAAFVVAASTAALTAAQHGEDPFTIAAAATLAAQSLPLLVRRRHPVAVWFVVALASLFEW